MSFCGPISDSAFIEAHSILLGPTKDRCISIPGDKYLPSPDRFQPFDIYFNRITTHPSVVLHEFLVVAKTADQLSNSS